MFGGLCMACLQLIVICQVRITGNTMSPCVSSNAPEHCRQKPKMYNSVEQWGVEPHTSDMLSRRSTDELQPRAWQLPQFLLYMFAS